MNALISRNRKAVLGIAGSLMLASTAAFTLGAVAPDFSAHFSANATEVVTGETPAVSLMIDSAESSFGVLADGK